jgi:hypothetical protein
MPILTMPSALAPVAQATKNEIAAARTMCLFGTTLLQLPYDSIAVWPRLFSNPR